MTISGHLNDVFTRNNDDPHVTTLQPSAGGASTNNNKLLAYNLITLEDAERKY